MTQVPVRVPVALLQVQVGLLTSQVYNYQYFGLVQAPQVTVPVPLVQVQVQYKYQHHKYQYLWYKYSTSTNTTSTSASTSTTQVPLYTE